MAKVLIKRGTRAQIDASAAASGLAAGELYLITDESRLCIGLSPTTYGAVAQGNDARLSDARTPTAHAASHGSGQADAVAIAASQVTSGVLAMSRLATGTPDGTKFIRDDGTLQVPSGGGGLDINGLTDIGAALEDADTLPVYAGSASANRKSAVSRIWTYIQTKIASGIAPYLTGYTQQGLATAATAAAYYSGTTLTIPLDGRVYDFDFPGNNITIAFGSPPSAPTCTDTVLILKQRTSGTMYGITAWPAGIKWPGGIAQTMPQTLSARMRVVISVSPSGIYDVSAMWMGV